MQLHAFIKCNSIEPIEIPDGVINDQDIIKLKNYLANYDYDLGTSTVEITSGADANGDGIVSGLDVIRLIRYMAEYDYDTASSPIVLGK